MTARNDPQSSLAEIDRRLRELQQELASVSQRPAETPPAPEAPAASADTPADIPVTNPPPPANPPAPAAADAPATGAAALDEAAAKILEAARQTEGLIVLRDHLVESARALQAQAQAQAPETSAAPAEAAPAPPAEAPAGAPAPAQPGLAPQSPAPQDPPAGGEANNHHSFDGEVVVNAGPFLDIGALGEFEHALATVPNVQDVYVRGFEGNRALIDLKLGGAVHLVDEMRRALPVSFGVVEVGGKLLTINVDSSSAVTGAAPQPAQQGA